MSKSKCVTSVSQLKSLCADRSENFFISLAGGLIRSSKDILYDSQLEKFQIHNNIDGTIQLLTENQLSSHSNIGEAIRGKAFFVY